MTKFFEPSKNTSCSSSTSTNTKISPKLQKLIQASSKWNNDIYKALTPKKWLVLNGLWFSGLRKRL